MEAVTAELSRLRAEYHATILDSIVRIFPGGILGNGYPNFADENNKTSVKIAWCIFNLLHSKSESVTSMVPRQTVEDKFETTTRVFLQSSFDLLTHIRPGRWRYETSRSIASFDQYQHLAYLTKALNHDKVLKTMLGANSDYIVAPDIVVSRLPITDEEINQNTVVLDDNQSIAANTRLRIQNNPDRPLLHASISCKWTIRSDRTQNTRTEALNLIRNRKGNLPHIVAVTAEPLPTRIAAIALGTGDLDCVYHFALPELRQSLIDLENEDQLDMLDLMVGGMRLRDISDLPFDLAV
jgi:hypothetical protein